MDGEGTGDPGAYDAYAAREMAAVSGLSFGRSNRSGSGAFGASSARDMKLDIMGEDTPEDTVRHCLNRMLLCRLLTKGCAAVWRHKAFVLAYRWLINKRKEMRDAVPKPALDPDVLASVGPRVAEAFQVSYKLIDQIDIVLLNQYLRTAEDNTPAALAGLKFLVQLHEAEHREKAPVQAEIDVE